MTDRLLALLEVLAKAGWKNNTELTKYCVRHGLIEPEWTDACSCRT